MGRHIHYNHDNEQHTILWRHILMCNITLCAATLESIIIIIISGFIQSLCMWRHIHYNEQHTILWRHIIRFDNIITCDITLCEVILEFKIIIIIWYHSKSTISAKYNSILMIDHPVYNTGPTLKLQWVNALSPLLGNVIVSCLCGVYVHIV